MLAFNLFVKVMIRPVVLQAVVSLLHFLTGGIIGTTICRAVNSPHPQTYPRLVYRGLSCILS